MDPALLDACDGAMERKLRITTGLILFAYAAVIFSAMRPAFSASRRWSPSAAASCSRHGGRRPGAAAVRLVLVHAALGLYALFRRRHLRIPASEAWQLALGLAIPLFLAPHVINVRVGATVFGLDDSYRTMLGRFWIAAGALAKHFALLGLVWAHGCIGLGFWLRRYDWSRRPRDLLLAGAVALPLLAALGIVNAGWDAADFGARSSEPRERRSARQSPRRKTRWPIGRAICNSSTSAARPRRRRLARAQRRSRGADGGARHLSQRPRCRRAARVFRPRDEPLGRHCACLVLRRARPLLDLPRPDRRRRQTICPRFRPPSARRWSASKRRRMCASPANCGRPPTSRSRRWCRSPALRERGHAGDESREMLVTAMFIDLRDSTRSPPAACPSTRSISSSVTCSLSPRRSRRMAASSPASPAMA